MKKWNNIESMLIDLMDDYRSSRLTGMTDDQAITKIAAKIAVNKDNLFELSISFGLARILIDKCIEMYGFDVRRDHPN